MTREDFISLLPRTIICANSHTWKLEILADNKMVKTACYVGPKKIRAGYRSAESFPALYMQMVNYLEQEVFQ